MKQKLLASILIVAMLFSLVPAAAFAIDSELTYNVLTEPADGKNGTAEVVKPSSGKYTGTSYTIPDTITHGENTYDVIAIGAWAFHQAACTTMTIGNNVETIGNNAFYNCAITKIVIPDSVTSIGNYAFNNCDELVGVTIGNNVETIGNSAFSSCDMLADVIIGNKVETIGESAFYNCVITEIVIPDSVTSIGDRAFNNCDKLADVTIGNKVETIGVAAFYNCDSLQKIVIPDSVTTLGENVFSDCSNLEAIIIVGDGPTNVGGNAYGANGNLKMLNVNGGMGGGLYKSGTEATITANTVADKHFVQWDGVDSLSFVNGTTTTSAAATFTMPTHDVTVTANFAEHTYTETKYDTDNHWKACACGEEQAISEVAAHSATGSNAATCMAKAKCDVCGTEFGDLLAHNYVMQNDTNEHWKQCTVCNTEEQGSRAVHGYDDAYDVSCNTCGYTRTVTPPTPPTPPTGGSSEFTGDYNYPVTVSPNDNGSAILSDSNAVAGESVTITTKPNKGYGAAEVIVTDEDGNIIPVTDLGNGKYEFTMPDCEVNIEVVYKPAITLAIHDLYINVFGKTIKNDVSPIIVGDRTMLPIRVIAEALGADVDWDAETQKVTIIKGDTVIELFIGKYVALVNGEPVQLDAAPFIDNSRTYLPVRFVSEYLGAVVHWDGDTRTVTVIPE